MFKLILTGMTIQAMTSASIYALFNQMNIATQQAIVAAILTLIILTLTIANRTGNIIIASRIDIDED